MNRDAPVIGDFLYDFEPETGIVAYPIVRRTAANIYVRPRVMVRGALGARLARLRVRDLELKGCAFSAAHDLLLFTEPLSHWTREMAS